jgi:hypothetical protein
MELFGSPTVNAAWMALAKLQAAVWTLEGEASTTREEVQLLRTTVEDLVMRLRELERTLQGSA